MVLYGATVEIEDLQDPDVGTPATPLADGAWHRGDAAEVGVTVGDNTGIRQLQLLADGAVAATKTAPGPGAGGCGERNVGVAYTFVAPCLGGRGLGGNEVLGLPAGWPEGSKTLTVVAEDPSGRKRESVGVTVRVDRSAPGVAGLGGDEGWGQAPDGMVTWGVPAETDRAPVVKTDVRVCMPARDCEVVTLGGLATERVVTALPEGETTVAVRREDSAGNVGEFGPAVVRLRRDRSAPVVTASGPAAEIDAGAFLALVAEGSDAISGVERLDAEWRVDGGAWQPYGGPFRGEAGRRYEIRARAVDRAGLTSPYVVFATAVRSAAPGPIVETGTEPKHPRLAIKTARKKGRYLIVNGTVAPELTSRVRVRVKLARRKRVLVRRVSPVGGHWRARVRLPRSKARRASVRASVPGGHGFAAGRAARTVRWR
jgi:hypothetical protein